MISGVERRGEGGRRERGERGEREGRERGAKGEGEGEGGQGSVPAQAHRPLYSLPLDERKRVEESGRGWKSIEERKGTRERRGKVNRMLYQNTGSMFISPSSWPTNEVLKEGTRKREDQGGVKDRYRLPFLRKHLASTNSPSRVRAVSQTERRRKKRGERKKSRKEERVGCLPFIVRDILLLRITTTPRGGQRS